MKRYATPWHLMLLFTIVAAAVYIHARIAARNSAVSVMEALLVKQDCKGAPLASRLDEGIAVIAYSLKQPDLLAGFYLRNRAKDSAIRLQGETASEIRLYRSGIIHVSASGTVSRIDDDPAGWEFFEIVPPAREPSAQRSEIPEFQLNDGFTRVQLGQDDGWRIAAGAWRLNQHGGGLPADSEQQTDYKVQRAVNAFSVLGSGDGNTNGILVYEAPGSVGDSFLAEATFYMGAGGSENRDTVRHASVPPFLIAQGNLEGQQVGFGWWPTSGTNTASSWTLCKRTGDAPWQTIATWSRRPPRTNWARIGIGIYEGHRVAAFLNGEEIGLHTLEHIVSGPLHLHTGSATVPVEFDDVHARPLTSPQKDNGNPILVRSANFSEKESYGLQRDPVEFEYWARGENTYILSTTNHALNSVALRGTTRLPLYGDFTYRSTPALPPGEYLFHVLSRHEPQTADDILATLSFIKTNNVWNVDDKPFTLSFGRRAEQLHLFHNNGVQPLTENVDGPVYLSITQPGNTFNAELHNLRSPNIWHDLFEEAPAGWYWSDGYFGMNSRWSCQPGWNFMAGASPALAAVFSQAAYYGDQHIESFMSLSMTLPKEMHYYIRNNLCVSYCTDGRNLNSGYTLVFGGWQNTKTALFRKNNIVASTSDPAFLLPPGTDHHNVHWLWWNFEFSKQGSRILLKYNGNVMFDFDDPDPLDGGHTAFWTVGNGVVISRVTSAAQRRIDRPQNAFHEFTKPSADGWQPLYSDAVHLAPTNHSVTVTNPMGGGRFAVRRHIEVDLTRTPVLDLPLRLGPGAKINLHIEWEDQPWIVRINAPLDNMEYFLTPSSAKVHSFGRPMITPDQVAARLLGETEPTLGRVRINLAQAFLARGIAIEGQKTMTLTLGNSSNADFLLAGFGGNGAGSAYTVGEPEWSEAE